MTRSPCYQFVWETSDSPAMTGRMSNDSTFSNQLRFIAPKLHGNYNQGQYGATWFKPGSILQKHSDLMQPEPAGYSNATLILLLLIIVTYPKSLSFAGENLLRIFHCFIYIQKQWIYDIQSTCALYQLFHITCNYAEKGSLKHWKVSWNN